ncbi:MAG: fibronectin type III domain-containing protein, partial [Actinobacteria bacterium]|nr:fibronectin type III domain-containing protein [Actinomycetota bacterium]
MTVRAKATLAVGLAALLILALIPCVSVIAASTPSGVHLTWQNDPHSTVTVTWFTDQGLSGYTPTVRYGTSTGNYTKSTTGTSHTYSGATVDVHDVEVTGLSPGTTYYYTCGDATHGFSGEKSFGTPPEYGGFKFCAYGDSRNNPWYVPHENNDLSIWEKVADAVADEGPLFNIFTADFIYDGDDEDKWNLWFLKFDQLSGESAFMSCHGNHEKYANAYFERFAFPGNEQWYSFDVSNVHFVCLDTGLKDDDEYALLSGAQKTWLESDLQAASAGECDWIVAFFHRHPYASGGSHGDQSDVIDVLVPLFDQYGVDLVFNGHTHYYERSLPMKGGEVVDNDGSFYHKVGGTIYVIAGGAGAPLANPGSEPWVAHNEKAYHYCAVDVKADNTLVVTAKRYDDGSVLDQFTMSKKTPPVVTSVDPASALAGEAVTIKGQEFGSARGPSYVLFGALEASAYESWGDGSVKVKVPGMEPGEVDVKVVTPEGTSNGVPFTVLQAGAFQRFYFAEGTCRPNFEPYICIQNPGEAEAEVEITFMPGAGENIVQPLTVSPRSRRTVRVKDVLGEGDDDAHDFSCLVESTNGAAIIAERPMYFNYQGMWDGGHDVIGTNEPGGEWYFAEGTCRPNFEPYICIQNPGEAEAEVEITFMPGAGENMEQPLTVPPLSRHTVRVKDVLGEGDDDAHDFSCLVESTNGAAIIAERPMYFNYNGTWDG